MLHDFIESHREELVERCRVKVGQRTPPPVLHGKHDAHANGVSSFVGQLIDALRLDSSPRTPTNALASEPSDGAPRNMATEIGTTAAKNGEDMLRLGFTVGQVVDDYGDLCQAIVTMAIEKGETISAHEFLILNGCLDVAMADSVTEFSRQRDRQNRDASERTVGEQLGLLAHDLRNHVNTAILAFQAIKGGGVGLHGATSAVLERSFAGLRERIDLSLAQVRLATAPACHPEVVDLVRLSAELGVAAGLEAAARQCELAVTCEPGLAVEADRQMLSSAVANLLQNAIKFTRAGSEVSLNAYAVGERVLIEVEDRCGGLPEGKAAAMFAACEQCGADGSGGGLGLSIARRAVEANAGTLSVRDKPGIGCVFAVDIPRVRCRTDETAAAL